jgi:hypothetical protein
MASHCVPRVDVPTIDTKIFGAAELLALAMGRGDTPTRGRAARCDADRPALVGVWVSADGGVRLDVRADGRYDLDIAGRHRRTGGTYRADRWTVLLEADGGLRTTAQFDEATLELAGHRLHRATR